MSVTLPELRTALRKRADPAYLVQLQRLVPGVKSIGVRVPAIKELAAVTAKQLAKTTFAELLPLVDALCAGRVRDDMLLGVFVLARRKKDLAVLPWESIERWATAVDNWETCDQLATNVIAPRVAAEPSRVPSLLRWSRSPNFWLRRVAVATTVGLNQRGRANPEAIFSVCEPLLADPEPMVRKAVGWALREASEHDPKGTFAFLVARAVHAHPSVVREGAKKLPEKQRIALGR